MDCLVLSIAPDHNTVAGYSPDFGGAFAMAYYRKLLAVLICTCFLGSSIVGYAAEMEGEEGAAASAPPVQELPPEEPGQEPPAEDIPPQDEPEPGGGEVIVEDKNTVYHIEAESIIIQTAPADQPPPEEESEALEEVEEPGEEEDIPSESELEAPADITAYALDSDGFPFYGSCWIRGYASSLGDVLLLFPMNYRDGYIGLDSSGRIFNVSNNSWTGLLYAGSSSYTVNFGAWGLPVYRVYNGSGYQNVTLYLTPEDTDLLLPYGPDPVYRVSDLLPYAAVLLLGGVLVCCMRKL